MLSGYLGRLFEVADELTAPQRLDAGRAAIELLVSVRHAPREGTRQYGTTPAVWRREHLQDG
ncbi:hypothetical protein [Pseudonocardia alaniniphila]|uniref:Uncharacterized protein n=1 Tax=Pseudonocardia alaniniphila TaxID=75291 RepID=A0ABS9TJ99_9PSEU|nr:hypothetical protein [Pseudonocardia alaniniphila]MCH6168596.1 hypothetical protein [Pseudonocardia alaniniphila]